VERRGRAGGVSVRITVGNLYEDVSLLAESVRHLAEDVEEDILDGWHETPDEFDAYISFDRGRYHVSLEATRVGDYPSREVAEMELARAMVAAGVFPNAWLINDHGNHLDINDDIRRWHDEGGDQMAPIPGVQYQPGDRVWTTDMDWPYIVVGDWAPPAWKSTPRATPASGHTSPTGTNCAPTPTDPDRSTHGRHLSASSECIPVPVAVGGPRPSRRRAGIPPRAGRSAACCRPGCGK